jgi:hypothetical protein
MTLGEQFYDGLTAFIDEFSGMELTNAEAVGLMMFKINELMNSKTEDECDFYEEEV